jgi:hypothetical protein
MHQVPRPNGVVAGLLLLALLAFGAHALVPHEHSILAAQTPEFDVPPCLSHDPKQWHPLVERNSNGSLRCTYGHEHKDDPRVLDELFGALPWGTLEYPWPAPGAAPGSAEDHRTFEWAVVTDQACPVNSLGNLRLQTHNGHGGAVMRFHSYLLQAETCDDTGARGQITIGGWADFGQLVIEGPSGPERVGLLSDYSGPFPLPNQSLRRLHGHPDGGRRGDMTWYGSNDTVRTGDVVAVTLGIRREDWGPYDPARPADTNLRYGPPFNGSWHEPAHLIGLYVPEDLDGGPLDQDGQRDGYVSHTGATERYGNLLTVPCTPPGLDCVPLWLERVRVGHYQLRADERGLKVREYDVEVNGQSVIQYPN